MELKRLAKKLGEFLLTHQLKLVTAESCTGGWVAQVMTSLPGSSQWFERGFITYSDESKHELLSVTKRILKKYGSVSKEVAYEMAEGALKNSCADISLAITGIAGPEGGTADKPVGTVWFAWAGKFGVETRLQHFQGDREMIRKSSVCYILKELVDFFNR